MTNRSSTTRNMTGLGDTVLNNATYNMIQGLHNLVDAVWHYDVYIEQDDDDDAKEMWRRFKKQQTEQATELRDHLSRRLQHVTGPAGKVGHGPHEGGSRNVGEAEQAGGKREVGGSSSTGKSSRSR